MKKIGYIEKGLRTCVISDIHLGSWICRTEELISFLKFIRDEIDALVINGDLFDSMNARLTKEHWKVLSLLRKMSDDISIHWVVGNHDYPLSNSQTVADLLGIHISKEVVVGGNTLCVHGDYWDDFITERPKLTWLADCFYHFLQKVDNQCRLARFIKNQSKIFLRITKKVECGVRNSYSDKFQYMICGHTHKPVDEIRYLNCGCWTELPCHYVIIEPDGLPTLYKWVSNGNDESVPF